MERILLVADRVAALKAAGQDVVVVVSAMGDTTDELLALAHRVAESPARRELDILLSAGERICMALLSMALNARGVAAVSFTGSQSSIITNDVFAIPKGPAHPVLAHKMIDWLSDQKNAEPNYLWYEGFQPPRKALTP